MSRVDSVRCGGCGGRNLTDVAVCEFCGLPLPRVEAARASQGFQRVATPWIAAVLVAIALAMMLIVRLGAEHLLP